MVSSSHVDHLRTAGSRDPPSPPFRRRLGV